MPTALPPIGCQDDPSHRATPGRAVRPEAVKSPPMTSRPFHRVIECTSPFTPAPAADHAAPFQNATLGLGRLLKSPPTTRLSRVVPSAYTASFCRILVHVVPFHCD